MLRPGIAPVHLCAPVRGGIGEGLGEAIAHRLNEDGVVVVVVRLQALAMASPMPPVTAKAPIQSGTLPQRRHIVRQTVAGEALLRLLAQGMPAPAHLARGSVGGVNLDAVPTALAGNRPKMPAQRTL